MITINATGDTTIHTANKYCPEDILVRVPAGGTASSDILIFTLEDGSTIQKMAYATDLFSTLKSLTISQGKVIKITDVNGNILWEEIPFNDTAILRVNKITSNTYANDTSYTDESFILLDIYPKVSGTVSITYGGLTKTITDTSGEAEPTKQQVFFGTFNGVTDDVETPTSGTLIIEGDYRGFGAATYNTAKASAERCFCITNVEDFGKIEFIPYGALWGCTGLTSVTIPSSVISIEGHAFHTCTNLVNVTIPNSVIAIHDYAFYGCSGLTGVIIPDGVTAVDMDAFANCTSLTNVVIGEGVTTIDTEAFRGCIQLTNITIPANVNTIYPNAFNGCTNLTSAIFRNQTCWYFTLTKNELGDGTSCRNVSNSKNNSQFLTVDYVDYYWYRS